MTLVFWSNFSKLQWETWAFLPWTREVYSRGGIILNICYSHKATSINNQQEDCTHVQEFSRLFLSLPAASNHFVFSGFVLAVAAKKFFLTFNLIIMAFKVSSSKFSQLDEEEKNFTILATCKTRKSAEVKLLFTCRSFETIL